jgi:hypothetical protein
MSGTATPMSAEQRVETIARVCHEANRAWCAAHGDLSQEPWRDAEQWQRDSALEGVQVAFGGATPEEQHEAWCVAKERDGWRYGPVKDGDAKTHPCLVPYDRLPGMQRAKDALFGAVVRSLAPVLGLDG